MKKSSAELSPSQKHALKILEGRENVFLTGGAGSGKSFLLRRFLQDSDRKRFPTLASTGAAAILVGGRTFHSFFGLGILEGGVDQTVERAGRNQRLIKRLQQCDGVVIDEVSMLSGPTLQAAERIARLARGHGEQGEPWGGLRVIAVGDFAQLPPVNPYSSRKEWAFLDSVWDQSEFQPVVLTEIHRTKDVEFLEVLGDVRVGRVTERVKRFLDERTREPPGSFEGTRLLARREDVERINLQRLAEIASPERTFLTSYSGKERDVENFRKNAPIPDVITLKEGALVMIRQNDPAGRWVNGSLGHLHSMRDTVLGVTLLSGRDVEIDKAEFTLLDADGKPVASASNFPVSLAWALTIHKAQGATLDGVCVDLQRLWEPGQAYVALSRATRAQSLYLQGWTPRSIFADPEVTRFHAGIGAEC